MLSRSSLIFLFVIGLFSGGGALSLDELISKSYERSYKIRSAELKYRAQETDVKKALSSFLPNINFQSTYSRTEKLPELKVGSGPFVQRVPFGFKDNYQNNLSLSYTIFAGGLRVDAYRLAKNMAELSLLELEQYKVELKNRVEIAYYGFKLAEASVAIAESSLSRSKDHYMVTLEQFEQGRVSDLSVKQAELSLSQAEQKLKEAEHQLELARVALNVSVGFPPDTSITIDGKLEFVPFSTPVESLILSAFLYRPELRALKYYARMASINKDLALKRYLPKLGLSLTYSYNKPFYFENEYKSNFTTTVFLSIPLFDGLANKYDYDKSKIELEKLESDENLLRQAIEFEVRGGYIELDNALLSVKLAEKSLELARSAYTTAQEQFSKGFISNLEYKDAELQYTQAEFGYIFAIYKYLVAYSNLMKASFFDKIKEEGK